MKEILKKALSKNTGFWIFAVASIVLLVVSFILPPTGAIDPSVLTATGVLFGFAALHTVVVAIGKGTDAKIKKGDIEVIIDNHGEIDIKD